VATGATNALSSSLLDLSPDRRPSCTCRRACRSVARPSQAKFLNLLTGCCSAHVFHNATLFQKLLVDHCSVTVCDIPPAPLHSSLVPCTCTLAQHHFHLSTLPQQPCVSSQQYTAQGLSRVCTRGSDKVSALAPVATPAPPRDTPGCLQGRALQPVLAMALRCEKLLEGSDAACVLCSAVEQGQHDAASGIAQLLPRCDQVRTSSHPPAAAR
jgi:hypothetical protein